MTKRVLGVGALLLVASAVALAETSERWLHVRVEETGEKAESIRVNLPLKVAIKVLPAIQVDKLRGGKIRGHHAHINGIDLRALVEAVRMADDGEFVTVESRDEKVRVAKRAGFLLVNVEEREEGREETNKVEVQVPMAVVEALLSGEKDELNILAAVEALAEHGEDVLVRVHDKDSVVRVWVDSKPSTE